MNELFRDRVHFVTPLSKKLIYGVQSNKNRDFIRIKSRSLGKCRPNYIPHLESWQCVNFGLGLRWQDAYLGTE